MVTLQDNLRAFPRLFEAEELLHERKYDDASFKVIEHLRENRDEPRGLALLGKIAMATGAAVQAEQFFRRAIARGASSLDVKGSLATALLNQDRLVDALDAFSWLERKVGDLEISFNRALILDQLGRSSEAIEAHEKIIAKAPSDARYWIAYGQSLRFAGRTDEAIAAFRHVADSDPERGEAWWNLADIKSKTLTDEDMAAMESALPIAVDVLNLAPLHMALGRAWHDRGQHDRAFDHYREGNRLRAEAIKYDPRELTNEVGEFIAMTSSGVLKPLEPTKGPTPIFLVSLPRSGSTLLEQILDRHPLIEAIGELPHARAVMRAALEMRMRRRHVTVPQLIEELEPEEAHALGQAYLQRAADHRRTDKPFFVDKMPTNWTDVLFIRKILPQARFLEIRRNPMDCCFSNYSHNFGSAHASSFDLVHQARSCVDYWRFTDHLAETAPGFMCNIRYEALIDEPKPVLMQVLDYLGLEWDEDLLRFYESERSIRTPSAEQVRQPLNRKGIGIWKPYAQWLGPLRDALGPLADA